MIGLLSKGLDGAVQRQQVLANNIANVNTPGYKRQDVDFKDVLARNLPDSNQRLSLRKTHNRHISATKNPDDTSFPTSCDENFSYKNDGNNVDIDLEMTYLLKNHVYYNTLVSQLNSQFSIIKNVIERG